MQGPQKKKPLVLEQRQIRPMACRWRVPGHRVAAALQDTAVVLTWQPRPDRAFHLPSDKKHKVHTVTKYLSHSHCVERLGRGFLSFFRAIRDPLAWKVCRCKQHCS